MNHPLAVSIFFRKTLYFYVWTVFFYYYCCVTIHSLDFNTSLAQYIYMHHDGGVFLVWTVSRTSSFRAGHNFSPCFFCFFEYIAISAEYYAP